MQYARAQEQVIVAEPNLQLFTVLAAIQVAGYDAGTERPEQTVLTADILRDLSQRNIPSLPALQEFYRDHRAADPAHDFSQFISLALFLSPAPGFELTQSPSNLPPEVLDLKEMVPLLATFYREANIAGLWGQYLPAMEEGSERYRKFLAQVIQETSAYLRMDTPGYGNRRFAIYVSPLGAPNQTHARNYGDRYFIVVGPSPDTPEEEIRHGWLHYLLDPYPFRYPKLVESKADLQKMVARAPGLDPFLRSNFSLLLTESLIRAIQALRARLSPDAARDLVRQAVAEGYILTAYFFDAMEKFEAQPVGMRLYYPEMIEAISVKQEEERLAGVQFQAPAARSRLEQHWDSREELIRSGESSLAQGDYEQARLILETWLRQYGPQPRVLYGLALVASQQKQPLLAKEYFTQTATLASDSRMKAWSHIYLGRLLDVENNRKAAIAEYTAALAAGDPSSDTRAAAEKGLQESFWPAGTPRPPSSIEELEKRPRRGVPLGREDR